MKMLLMIGSLLLSIVLIGCNDSDEPSTRANYTLNNTSKTRKVSLNTGGKKYTLPAQKCVKLSAKDFSDLEIVVEDGNLLAIDDSLCTEQKGDKCKPGNYDIVDDPLVFGTIDDFELKEAEKKASGCVSLSSVANAKEE